jgi:hypothetical protein
MTDMALGCRTAHKANNWHDPGTLWHPKFTDWMGPKVTSLVACSSHGRCAQHLHTRATWRTSYANCAHNICVTYMYMYAPHPRIRRKCCMHLPREERTNKGWDVNFWTPLDVRITWLSTVVTNKTTIAFLLRLSTRHSFLTPCIYSTQEKMIFWCVSAWKEEITLLYVTSRRI